MAKSPALPGNPALSQWINECAELCKPDKIRWCNGSDAEYQSLLTLGKADGTLIPLSPKLRPNSYLHRSHPDDTARTEECTFVCTPTKDEAGPTNNWMEPQEAYAGLRKYFEGSMRGRTLYVVPFLMGPVGSAFSRVGIELTDSLYVAVNMRLMTRMGEPALRHLGQGADFTRCLHSTGEFDPKRRAICHFPQDNTIWSYGSGYGGNALLGKKCMALRVASYLGRQEGWMAEHMFVSELTSPDGVTMGFTGAFPSACGKTNSAMLRPAERFRSRGWKVSTLGDDIAWLRPSDAAGGGQLYAVNPENGFFGVLPGTSERTNPHAMQTFSRDSIFTNVALLPDGDVWWEGKTEQPPNQAFDWQGKPWTPDSGRKAAHPNSRFTAALANNPVLSPRCEDASGIPISFIVFGGRRSDTQPLVLESFDWTQGVYLGATLSSETTAAATGKVGVLRRDPMAMLPFCGYNMGQYLAHWLEMGKRLAKPPRIFHVNWFRAGADGKFLWPGYGENIRLYKWMMERCQGKAKAVETPLGWVPPAEAIDLEGSGVSVERFAQAVAVDKKAWLKEAEDHRVFFTRFGSDIPAELLEEHAKLLRRLA